jgi:hypothetical protein
MTIPSAHEVAAGADIRAEKWQATDDTMVVFEPKR